MNSNLFITNENHLVTFLNLSSLSTYLSQISLQEEKAIFLYSTFLLFGGGSLVSRCNFSICI